LIDEAGQVVLFVHFDKVNQTDIHSLLWLTA